MNYYILCNLIGQLSCVIGAILIIISALVNNDKHEDILFKIALGLVVVALISLGVRCVLDSLYL